MTTKSAGPGGVDQAESQHRRGQLSGGTPDPRARPEAYKCYPEAVRVELSNPRIEGGAGIWGAIRSRRSARKYADSGLSEPELSQLLWAAQGITRLREGVALRAAPSAGALYPVETYLAVHSVDAVEPGVYHYAVQTHELDQLRLSEMRASVARAALDQNFVQRAAVVLIWTAVFERCRWKYGQRAYRYVYLDAGHIAQNVALAAAALELCSCPIGAFYDDEVNDLLGVTGGEESAIYMTAIGRPVQRSTVEEG